jgi:site-specific recombinase XerD
LKKKINTLLPALAEYFSTYLPDIKGVSQNTIISYEYAFALLFEYINDRKGVPPEKVAFETLSEETILEYLNWLEAERGCSPATRNLRRTAISSFAKYAMKKNLREALTLCSTITNIPRKRTQKEPEIKYFTKEEIGILLNLPKGTTKIERRNAVLLSFLYASGARAQELCDLTVNDVYFGGETNVRLMGKGKKPRLVTIPDNCAVLLKNYLKSIHLDSKNPNDRHRHVFSSQTNEQMSISCVEEIVKKYVNIAKSVHPYLFGSSYSPHSFRHSIAVHMLECGESLVVIKAFLGHASIATTAVYASVTPELANKYLRERGKVIPASEVEQQDKANELVAALPFLRRFGKKG